MLIPLIYYLFVVVIKFFAALDILLHIILLYLYVPILCVHLYLITVLLHVCTCRQKWQNIDVESINGYTQIIVCGT